LWLAAGAAPVMALLEHAAARVRPAAEPVPRVIAGTPAGEIFGHLVRMNDGAAHQAPKLALQQALGGVDLPRLEARAQALASALGPVGPDGADLSDWALAVPITVVADLLGFDESAWPALRAWTADFVACLTPLSSPAQLESASAAAGELLARFKELVRVARPGPGAATSLVGQVQEAAQAVGWHQADALLANLVGLLSQTYEASAALIGNSVVALIRQPGLQDAMRAAAVDAARPGAGGGACAAIVALVDALVEEVSRHDAPVQNTRRFLAAPVTVAGVELEAEAVVLLVLAAANRDPQANPRPAEFLLERPARRIFTFGHGRHACPAQALACAMAAGALRALLTSTPSLSPDTVAWTYRPSANVRMPLFAAGLRPA
jgi:cytochrome P450